MYTDIYLENEWSNISTDSKLMLLSINQKKNDFLTEYKKSSIFNYSDNIFTEAIIDNGIASKNILSRLIQWFKKIFKKISDGISNIFKKLGNSGKDNDDILVPKDTEKNIKLIEKFQQSIKGLITKIKQLDWAGALKFIGQLAVPVLKIAVTVGALVVVKRVVVNKWLKFLDDSKNTLDNTVSAVSNAKDAVGNKIVECMTPIKDAATSIQTVTVSLKDSVVDTAKDIKQRGENVVDGYKDLALNVVGENNPRLINGLLKKSIGHKLSNGGGYAFNKETNQFLFRKDKDSYWQKVNPKTIISNLNSENEIKNFDKFVDKHIGSLSKSWKTNNLLAYAKKKFR